MIENSSWLYRQGGRGMYDEALALARKWGFEPADISPPVHLWHGELDDTVPVSMAHFMARSIPQCDARIYPDEGHHILFSRWAEILGTLA